MHDLSFLPPETREKFAQMIGDHHLQVPPPVFLDMDGEFLGADLEQGTLTVRFPVKERYQNPLGSMQGGMIAAAIDNAIGPLSFMVAPPNVTKTLTLHYKRPITSEATYIDVEAHYEGRTGRELTFTARALDAEGRVLVEAEALTVVVGKKRLTDDESHGG